MLVDLDVLCRNIKMPLKVPTLSCCFSQLEILTLRLPMHKPHDIAQSNFPKMLELKKLTVHYSANLDESLLDLTTFMRISPNLEEFVLMVGGSDYLCVIIWLFVQVFSLFLFSWFFIGKVF
ncbi:unnamed protein product [Cuscuta epithymum]|uniref:FBD domain-containing protein n=1 Tax=Cuscuta epithymum TaxID=186058 RepID=A0AAV0EC41_9ASTE|nr:unnamed protein product [Cuscuta epithymum]